MSIGLALTKAQTVRLARQAFAALAQIEGVGRAYTMALDGEKAYRRGDWRRYHPGAASAPACAELFVARWLAKFALYPKRIPTLADTLHLRADTVLCAVIVARGGAAVLAALEAAGIDPEQVEALDYVAAVSTKD